METAMQKIKRLRGELHYHAQCESQYRDAAARIAMQDKMRDRALDNAAFHARTGERIAAMLERTPCPKCADAACQVKSYRCGKGAL
jgi:hypothetical protein